MLLRGTSWYEPIFVVIKFWTRCLGAQESNCRLYIRLSPLAEEKQLCNMMMEELCFCLIHLYSLLINLKRLSGAGFLDAPSIMEAFQTTCSLCSKTWWLELHQPLIVMHHAQIFMFLPWITVNGASFPSSFSNSESTSDANFPQQGISRCHPHAIEWYTVVHEWYCLQHASYGLTSKCKLASFEVRVFGNEIVACRVPQRAFFSFTWLNLPFYTHRNFWYSLGSTFTSNSAKLPSIFWTTSFMFACMKAPGMSTISTSLFSMASITHESIKASMNAVGALFFVFSHVVLLWPAISATSPFYLSCYPLSGT